MHFQINRAPIVTILNQNKGPEKKKKKHEWEKPIYPIIRISKSTAKIKSFILHD